MSESQITAWIQVIQVLISAGYQLGSEFKALVASFHSDLTDAQINALLDDVIAKATAAKAQADADAGQTA